MEYGKITGVVKTETDKAVLVVVDGEEHWIPRSCFKRILKTPTKTEIKFEADVSFWFLNKNKIYHE